MKPRFQFSLRDLLLAVTLISVGLGVLCFVRAKFDYDKEPLASVGGLVSFAVIGAGVGAPFHRKLKGAVLGCSAPILLFVIFLIVVFACLAMGIVPPFVKDLP